MEKIEVWAHKHSHRGEWFVDEKPHETKIAGTQKPCTLVVHDDSHERVFTESEVKEILFAVDVMEQFTGAQVEMLREYGIFPATVIK
jgi:hypothetical protein